MSTKINTIELQLPDSTWTSAELDKVQTAKLLTMLKDRDAHPAKPGEGNLRLLAKQTIY